LVEGIKDPPTLIDGYRNEIRDILSAIEEQDWYRDQLKTKQETVEHARAVGDKRALLSALNYEGMAFEDAVLFGEAGKDYDECAKLARELGLARQEQLSVANHARVLETQRRLRWAVTEYESLAKISRRLNDSDKIVFALASRVKILRQLGDPAVDSGLEQLAAALRTTL